MTPANQEAAAFINAGGRLMVNAKGGLEIGMDLDRIVGPDSTEAEARRGILAARHLFRCLRDQRFARTIKCLVLQQGERTENGWIVLEG